MNAADQLIAEGERRGEAHGEAKGLRVAIATSEADVFANGAEPPR